MMMQPSTTMMKNFSYSCIWYSTTFIILRNHEEPLNPSSLPSKQRLVSWYSCYFNNLFILHQMSEGKAKKRESIVWGSTQLCAAFCDFISKSLPTKAVQGGKTSCASFCVSLIACVRFSQGFFSFYESSDWDWMKYARCERLVLVKAFFWFLLLLFFVTWKLLWIQNNQC